MALDEFDLIVLGDEPAGLWFLREYARLTATDTPSPRVAWVTIGDGAKPLSVSSWAAQAFQISGASPWSPEVLTPQRCYEWSPQALQQAFPQLPTGDWGAELFSSLDGPRSREASALRFAIRSRPELLALASTVFKHFGRTVALAPETLLWGALLHSRLQNWDPAGDLPTSVSKIVLPRSTTVDRIDFARRGALSFHFSHGDSVGAKHAIMNLDCSSTHRLLSGNRDLLNVFNEAIGDFSSHRLVPFDLRTDTIAIPSPVRQLTCLLDTETIPDWNTEMWSLEVSAAGGLESGLRQWMSVSSQLSLDTVLETGRHGLKRLNALFPFLPQHIISLYPPLWMETCHSDLARAETLMALESSSVELYNATSIQTDTRQGSLSHLFPFLRCHLPYPLGPLLAAKQMLRLLLGRKRVPKKQVPASASLGV